MTTMPQPLRPTLKDLVGPERPPKSQGWPATDSAVKGLVPGWLRRAGLDGFADELDQLGPLDEKAHRLQALGVLARATLTADLAALSTVTRLIEHRSDAERAHLVTSLGQLAATTWSQLDGPVRQAIVKAAEEQHLAQSMVEATQRALECRQADKDYARWISDEPDGLAGHAWSVALRVAGERLWDRNWAKVASLGSIPTRLGSGSNVPLKYQPGMLRLKQASNAARAAAVDALIRAALHRESSERICAWDTAVDAAHRAPGAAAWSADVDATRAGVGEAAWTAANQSARATVQVVVNELPYVVGRIAMLAMAGEACGAAARAVAIRAAVHEIADRGDAWSADLVATDSMRSALLDLSA